MNCVTEHQGPVPTEPESAFCGDCADRLWRELHWLADIFDPLFEALTRRLDIEGHVEQVPTSKSPGQLERGLDLNDNAIRARQEIQGVAFAGLSWLLERTTPEYARGAAVPDLLRLLARNLRHLTSDLSQAPRLLSWASRVVAARTNSEALLTPSPGSRRHPRWRALPDTFCERSLDGVPCGGLLGVWVVSGKPESEAVCQNNPAHSVPMGELTRQRMYRRSKPAATRRVVSAILD